MDQLLIVGGGLAGSILATEAASRKIKFDWMIGSSLPAASSAAYGMCNPVHFRNKVPAWMADSFYEYSRNFFKQLNHPSIDSFYTEIPLHHLVAEGEEFVQWRQQTESTSLWRFTNGDKQTHITQNLGLPYLGSIEISPVFFVNIPAFMNSVKNLYNNSCLDEAFDFKQLRFEGEKWSYNGKSYLKIIFAEGWHALKNPFFTSLPFNPCKGEIINIKIEGFNPEPAFHKKNVLVKLRKNEFVFGATYDWDDLSFENSVKGRVELEHNLKTMLGEQYTFEVLDQKAGVRPAMSDRRPVVGWHPKYEQIGILNGFGSRGLLVGPSAAKNIFDHWLNKEPLLPEWDVNRFRKRMMKALPNLG